MCRNKGFTLLEVLIALGLLAVLSAALYGTWFALMRGEESARNAMAGRRELRSTLDGLQRELSAAFYSTSNPRLHFVIEDRDFFGKPASSLNFTTISAPLSGGRPVSDQTEVRYLPVDKEGKIILAKMERDAYADKEPFPYPQMERLEGFLVECSPDGTKWVRSWDTALNRALPKAVRVTVTIKEGDKSVNLSTVASPRAR